MATSTAVRVELVLPREVVLGTSFDVQVVVHCDGPRTLAALAVDVECAASYFPARAELLATREVLGRVQLTVVPGRVELGAGRHVFVATLVASGHLLPSYRGARLAVEWHVRARADVAWWPDAAARLPLYVVVPELRVDDPGPVVFSTNAAGPISNAPYAEVSLPTTVFAPGQWLHGTVALGNTVAREYRGVRVRLIAHERIPHDWDDFQSWRELASVSLRVVDPAEGQSYPFSLQIPHGCVPAFGNARFGMRVLLRIELAVAASFDTLLPIVLHIAPAVPQTGHEPPVLLPVGAQRLSLVWSHVAQQTELEIVGDELRAVVGRFAIAIGRYYFDRLGIRVVARLSCVDLDLGLHLTERRRLHTRDPQQSAILAARTQETASAAQLGYACDHYLICIARDAGAYAEPVIAFAREVFAFARSLDETLAQLPPPADVRHLVPAFEAAADRMRARFDAASMDLVGMRGDVGFALLTEWDDEQRLSRSTVCVWPGVPIDGRWRQQWNGDGAPAPVPDGLQALLTDATGLQVDAEAIRVAYPPCDGDLEPLLDGIETLIAVAERLRGGGGVYR
mgnify:CR=1 FL=1